MIFLTKDNNEFITKVADSYFESRAISPSDVYKTAVHMVIDTMAFYDGPENRTAVIPLETGQGKTEILKILMSEFYRYDIASCGTIILEQYRSECDTLAKDINTLAGVNVAVAYHSNVKLSKKQLKKYPILVMTHSRFLHNIEQLSNFAIWKDTGNIHQLAIEPKEHRRLRLIIDESINKIDLLSISNESLSELDAFFQNQKNKKNYQMWQEIATKIRDMFVLPVLPSERNITKIVHLGDIEVPKIDKIPKELIDTVYFETNDSNRGRINRAFKAILNLSEKGGILKTSNDPRYRTIQTASYINIFSPLFTSIVLDGTARANDTYSVAEYFDVIDIPRTKTYENVTLHVDTRTTGSRAAIEKSSSLVTRTIDFINENLLTKDTLLICYKSISSMFTGLPSNITVTTWGAFSGSNEYNNSEAIVYCGVPYLDEAYYIHLYHIFSGDKDYSKDRTYKPSGRKDPVVRFVNDFDYENLRQSYLTTELVQSINRGVCRNYNNKVQMHCFMPFNDDDVLYRIADEMPGLKIIDDYDVFEVTDDAVEEVPVLLDYIMYVLLHHRDFFGDEMKISKSQIFDLNLIQGNFRCSSKRIQSYVWKSSQITELENIGVIKISHREIEFIDKAA